MCLKESCFPECVRSHLWFLCSRILERSTATNYRLVSLLSLVSKVFEKLVNNWLFDHLEKCDFQYSFRSARSTLDVVAVVSYRMFRAFNRSGATQVVVLYISKASDGVWHAGFPENFNQFVFFLVIEGFEWFWIGCLHKNIQLLLEFLKTPFLVLHVFYYTLIIFLMMLFVIYLSKLMILLSTLSMFRYLICCCN